MLRNHIKIAWRNLLNEKMYAVIKIGGFALGIAACLLIGMFIMDELSYDKHYPNYKNIYRVVGEFHVENNIYRGVYFPRPFAKTIEETCPEILKAANINPSELFGAGNLELRPSDQKLSSYETGLTWADKDIIDILQIPFVYGNPEHSLAEPYSMVISKSIADKYFPNENPVGKTIIINNNKTNPVKIGGVMEDFPDNSHFQYNFLLSLEGRELFPGDRSNWISSNSIAYVELKPGTNIDQLKSKLLPIARNYLLPPLIQQGSITSEQALSVMTFDFQPIADIHLRSDDGMDDLLHGDIRIVWIFGAAAIFILILACINFINLSTAKSANRAKEVGLRKTIGCYRHNLIHQFLTESLIYSFLSFGLGLIIMRLLLPYFNLIANKSLVIPFNEWWMIPGIILAAFFMGILAGFYPSLYLSRFSPAKVLKGTISSGLRNSTFRNGLVIFQFTASLVLIIGTLIIKNQMGYILNKKLGFNKDQVIILHGGNSLGNKVFSLKEELNKLAHIKSVSVSGYLPVEGTRRDNYGWLVADGANDKVDAYGQLWITDADYIKTLGMSIIEGRDFSNELESDSQRIIINEEMKKQLQLDDPIGKRISNTFRTWEVVGIIEDFHFENMKSKIRPLALILGNSPSVISVRVSTDDISSLITSFTSVWNKFSPNQEIRYSFLDEKFAYMHEDITQTADVFASFAILSIIVACLGLFGLVAYATIQRKKEIGIRKVSGAKGIEILLLLNIETIKWIVISLILACPISWLIMNKWLENFAYKTELSWWIFVLAGILAFGIALLTVSWHSWRAANMNPVEALRYE